MDRFPHVRPPSPPAPAGFDDPDFLRASAWLAANVDEPSAVVAGAPYAGASISRARCDLLPDELRRALGRFSVWSSDHGVSLEALPVLDAGDVEPAGAVEETQERIAAAAGAILGAWDVPLVGIGGDNSVTVGFARGASADALLTFDAHHDCRDPSVRITNGCPVRQLVEGGLERVAQIGIHGFANAEASAIWADEHGVRWFGAPDVRRRGVEEVLGDALGGFEGASRIWVDVDLDVLDRAFAPGAPAAMPGGLWPEHLERAAFLLGRDPRVCGLDVVEVDPEADVAAVTVRTAAAVMLGFLAGVALRP